MAYHCIRGKGECDGCMDCRPEPEPIYCDICGAEVEYLYKDINGDVVGCDQCIRKIDPYEE